MAKARDVGLYFGGTLLNQAVSFFTGLLVARWLGPAQYGVLSITRNIYAVAVIFAPLGLDLALLRHFGENRGDWRRSVAELSRLRLMVSLVNVAVVVLVAAFGGRWVEAHLFHMPDMAFLLLLSFLALPFAADIAVLTATLRALERTDLQNIIALWVQPLVRGGLIGAAVLMHGGLRGIVLTTAVGALITDGLMHIVLSRHCRTMGYTRRPLEPQERAALWRVLEYSVWLALMLFAYNFLRNMDVLVLGRFRPPAEVGQYAALSTIAFIVQIFPQALAQTLGPRIARAYTAGDMASIRAELSNYFRRALLLSAPLFAGIAAFGPWLDLLFGPKYHFSLSLSVNLAAAYLISGTLMQMGSSLAMTGRHRLEFAILLVGSAGSFLLCCLLIPRFGSNGAAIAITVGYLAINGVRMAVSARFLGGFDIRWTDLLIPVSALIPALAISLALSRFAPHGWPAVIGGGALLLVILAILYRYVLLTAAERGWLSTLPGRARLSMARGGRR